MKKTRTFLSLVLVLIMYFSVAPMTELGIEAEAATETTFSAMKERAEAIISYKWTPSQNINTWNNNTYNGRNYFKKGETVTGMPYTLFTTEVVSFSLLSLNQYKSKASTNYSATAYCVSTGSNRTGPVYGSCCADFICEVFGGSFMNCNNMRYHNVQGIQKSSYGTTTKNVKASAIKAGDALSNTNGTHIVWVGEVTDSYFMIYEQTPPVAKKTKVHKSSSVNSDGYLVLGGLIYNIVTKSNEFTEDETFKEYLFNGKMKVTASSKAIKALPYGSSETVKTVVTNDEISVVSYVYNKYGNLWYKTSSGNYIHSNYLEVVENDSLPPSNYLYAKFKVMCSEKNIKSDPISSSETIGTIKRNDIVTVTGYVYNEYGTLYYVLGSGGHIYHNYLSVQSSSIRTPSDYINTTMLSRAKIKTMRVSPYGSSESAGTVSTNSTVNIHGYVYNRYGDLWYMTDKEQFIFCSYLEQEKENTKIPSNYKYHTFIAQDSKSEKIEPYNVAKTNRNILKGETVTTIGYITNLYGNKWYLTNTNYYVYPSNLKCVHQYVSKTTKPSSCTETGVKTFTCSLCNDSYIENISKTAHNSNTTIPAVAATCTKSGLTEGKKCSVCGTVTLAQQTIAAKGHSEVKLGAVAPTCTKTGLTEGKKCSVCGTVTVAQQTIAAKGHSEVKLGAVAATCTKTGLTEGKKCSVCGTVTVAQQTIAAKGHTDGNGDYKCDYNCGYEYEKPAEPEVPSDPSENCSCNCHKGGIAGFFFKIINFFQKLFGMNKVCECGAKH